MWSFKLLSSKSLKASKGNGTPPGTFWELPLGYKRPAQLTLIDTAIGVRLAVLFDKGTLFLLQRFLVLCPLSHSSIFAFSNDYMKTGLVGEFKWRNGLFLFWLLFCTDDDWYTFKAPMPHCRINKLSVCSCAANGEVFDYQQALNFNIFHYMSNCLSENFTENFKL